MSQEIEARQRLEIRSSDERQQAESMIRGRVRKSKRLGRGLAVLTVATGITLGLSNKEDEPQVIASEAAIVGSMVAVGVNERKVRRHCDKVVDEYAAAVRQGVGLAIPDPSAVAPSEAEHSTGARWLNPKTTDKFILPFGAALMPFIAGIGAGELADYAKNGGPLLPQFLLGHNAANHFEPGIAIASAEVAMGVGFMCLSGASSVSEKGYLEQLNKVDGTSEMDRPLGIMND